MCSNHIINIIHIVYVIHVIHVINVIDLYDIQYIVKDSQYQKPMRFFNVLH